MTEPDYKLSSGQRVQLHPGTDRWMMGDRWGQVIGRLCTMGQNIYRVKLDTSGKTVRFKEDDLLHSGNTSP